MTSRRAASSNSGLLRRFPVARRARPPRCWRWRCRARPGLLYAHNATQRGVGVWPADWQPLTSEELAELTEEAEAELEDDEEEDEDGDAS